jgi:hypothetical protein
MKSFLYIYVLMIDNPLTPITMCEYDFFSVQAISSSIRSLMQIETIKRGDIKSHKYYTNERFPKVTHTASVAFVPVMGIGHLNARERVDELVSKLPSIAGVTYHVRFFPVD